MLTELRRITSAEPYKSRGGMWVRDISIKPWEKPDAKFLFELSEDDMVEEEGQLWEVTCTDLAKTDGIPQALIPTTQIKIFDNHPLLWQYASKIYFSVTSTTKNIPALMGELFIEHSKACGNWVDFEWLYAGLPETLSTMRENQLAIPAPLEGTCFGLLEKYDVQYTVNEVGEKEPGYSLLLFSNEENWPDNENFRQSYIIAKTFLERRLR
jgi:hypothetical protein